MPRKLTVHAASSPVVGHLNKTVESASAAETPFRAAGQRIEGLQAGSRAPVPESIDRWIKLCGGTAVASLNLP
jgi:hypothetical protein